jgi:hypothetical protein
MFKTVSIFAAAMISVAPALAETAPSNPVTFRHGGNTYTYTIIQKSNYRVIEGMVVNTRTPFSLNVGPKNVWGSYNGSDIGFPLTSVKSMTGIVVVE